MQCRTLGVAEYGMANGNNPNGAFTPDSNLNMDNMFRRQNYLQNDLVSTLSVVG